MKRFPNHWLSLLRRVRESMGMPRLFLSGACREPKSGKRQHQLRRASADSQPLEGLSNSPGGSHDSRDQNQQGPANDERRSAIRYWNPVAPAVADGMAEKDDFKGEAACASPAEGVERIHPFAPMYKNRRLDFGFGFKDYRKSDNCLLSSLFHVSI
jgi:hypothetical protein